MSSVSRLSSLVGNASHHHGPHSPEAQTARANLAEAQIARAIERNLAKAPPLRPEQLDRLRALLNGGAK